MRSRTWSIVAAFGFVIATLAALINMATSTASGQVAAGSAGGAGDVTKAIAMIHPLGNSKVEGKVVFTKVDGGLEIAAELSGLTPGKHGFHVHEFGDCSVADGKCAGGHFNPEKKPHAGPDAAERHDGDFGNIESGADGKATYKRVDKLATLNGPHSIIGRAVIVHAAADDLKTQDPPGNAGARLGCGVIGIADPKMQH
jgi:Cu-Zn family superoxide dismutase